MTKRRSGKGRELLDHELDLLMRRAVPPVDVPPERVERMMNSVMGRIERRGGWFDRWTLALQIIWPSFRVAVPVAAAIIGVLVGTQLSPTFHGVNTGSLFGTGTMIEGEW